MTYIITEKEVKEVLDAKTALETVEKAFKAYGLGQVQMPAKSYLIFEKGDLRSMPAYIKTKDMDIAGIKSVNVHPNNKEHNLPTVMATILLTDPENGYNIAILDGTFITNMRTGASGGVASKYLSKKDSSVAGFVGAGAQAHTQLQSIMLVRPIKKIKVYDRNDDACEGFCRWAKENFGVEAIPVKTVQEAVENCDIVTATTPVRSPIVKKEWISPGTHINAIGADAKGKQELFSDLTKSCKIVIDDWTQASHSGEINIPIKEGVITKDDIYAELGQVVAGKKKGRENDDEITVFDSTGLAIQDVSTAFVVYEKLRKSGKKVMDVGLF